MRLEKEVLSQLRQAPASGGALIERLQARRPELLDGGAVLVYGALANLRARGEIELLQEAAGEGVWGLPGQRPRQPRAPGFPPSFGLGALELGMIDREVGRMTEGLPQRYFEELRRVVVADADRRLFHGVALPGAFHRALAALGPPRAARRLLRAVDRGVPVALTLPARRWRLVGVPLAILAALVLLRLFVVGIYTVPRESISMAPALVPAAEGGDVYVLANLAAYAFAPPRRGDVVIFEHLDQTYVKRAMGLPGETLSIREGDLFVNGTRLVKPRALLDRVKVPLGRYRDSTSTTAHAGYLLPDGTVENQRGNAVDVVFCARLRARSPDATITILIRDGFPNGHGVALGPRGLAYVDGVEILGLGLGFALPRECEIWVTNADRVFRVEVNGREIVRSEIPREGKSATVSFVAESVEVSDALLCRDLIYEPLDRSARDEFEVGPDQIFVLGDNSPRSRDSRHFRSIDIRRLKGRVFAVAWPWSRARWVR